MAASWIAAAKPASSAGRSRALTSTTVVRVDARSAIATEGATSNALLRGRGPARSAAAAPAALVSAASTDRTRRLRSRRSRIGAGPRPSSTSRLSSAMPSRVVWMRASMMFAPAAARPGADAVEQALAVGREDADRGWRRCPDRPRRPRSAWRRRSALRPSRPGARWRPARRAARPASSCRAAAGHGPGPRSPSSRAGSASSCCRCCDQLGPAVLLVAEPKPLLGGLEQGPQQRPLPLVPHARADRADVDHGQDQQQPQPLRALHLADEILDRLGIGEVALERGRRQQQMIADQPRRPSRSRPGRGRSAGRASARSRRRGRYGRRRGPWRCRAAAPRHKAPGATRSASERSRSTADGRP